MIRIRCDATRGIHACSLWLDWTGQHPGDHRAHPQHDLSRPVLCTWPNLGVRSAGIPVHVPAGGASGRSTPPAPSAAAPGASASPSPSPSVGPGAAPRTGGGTAAPRAPLPGTTTPKPAPQAPPPAPVAPRKPRWYEYEVTEWDLLPDA